MKALVKLLSPALGRDEVVRMALAHRVLRSWRQIVGETLGTRSCPDRYERGTVFVAVEGSAWAQELRLAKPQILARLAEQAHDRSLFTDLRFGVRPLQPMDLNVEVEATEEPTEAAPEERTIREIADARLRAWRADRI
jgi:predicted nucleic acid-binding Zn ribbon protein